MEEIMQKCNVFEQAVSEIETDFSKLEAEISSRDRIISGQESNTQNKDKKSKLLWSDILEEDDLKEA
jgi:hypothetical protein